MTALVVIVLLFCVYVFAHACWRIGRERRLDRRRESWDRRHGRPSRKGWR